MIKRLAVDHLHVVGDIFDRGPSADRIIDELMQHHSVDIQWGNHDILWMGAVCGSSICVANVIYNNIKYQNTQILENGYGIALRNLTIFADRTYKDTDPMKSAVKAIAVIMFKLEGQVIKRHLEYDMNDRLLLDKIDMENGTVVIDGKEYKVKDTDFPTVSKESPYELTKEEQKVINELTDAFVSSQRLRKHIEFLYEKGSMYKLFNDNLLFHGCIPLDDSGNFDGVVINDHIYKGRKYMDYAENVKKKLDEVGIRVELDTRSEKIGYKIREAQQAKIPYMLVVGQKEEEVLSIMYWEKKTAMLQFIIKIVVF